MHMLLLSSSTGVWVSLFKNLHISLINSYSEMKNESEIERDQQYLQRTYCCLLACKLIYKKFTANMLFKFFNFLNKPVDSNELCFLWQTSGFVRQTSILLFYIHLLQYGLTCGRRLTSVRLYICKHKLQRIQMLLASS